MKNVFRDRMRAQLAVLSDSDVRHHSAQVWERLAVLEEFAGAEWVLSYVSMGREIETHGLIRQLLALGRHVCVPVFDAAQGRYGASEVRDFDADLTAGKFAILEPKPAALRPVPLERAQAWLVPGLAFDETGNRLGRGRGYYDALLKEARGVKIALAHDFQVLPEVPAELHDVRVDYIVTENRTVRCRRPS
jgi:5-formyltetrahydrofolate cyclo-ligase